MVPVLDTIPNFDIEIEIMSIIGWIDIKLLLLFGFSATMRIIGLIDINGTVIICVFRVTVSWRSCPWQIASWGRTMWRSL